MASRALLTEIRGKVEVEAEYDQGKVSRVNLRGPCQLGQACKHLFPTHINMRDVARIESGS